MPASIKWYSTTLDCPEPMALAQFYAQLMNWFVAYHDEDFACVGAPGTQQGAYPCLTFQRNPDYVPPVWPEQPGAQQQMEHLDFAVEDLDAAVAHALHCGASVAPQQFLSGCRVLLDPAGHPFCLCVMPHVTSSPHFALR